MRRRLLSLALGLGLLAGCHATVDVNVGAKTTVKSGGLFANLVGNAFGDFSSIDLSQTSDFKNAGIRKEDVESVKLSGLKLSIVSPAGATFDFLDDITFFVESDGLPKVKIAEAHGIAADAKTVVLTVTNAEIAPYVTAPKMSLTTDATAHSPPSDTTIQADAVFTVDPKVF